MRDGAGCTRRGRWTRCLVLGLGSVAALSACRERLATSAPTSGSLWVAGSVGGERIVARTLDEAEDRFFDTGELVVRYRELGVGPPVLLLHGYSDRLEMWRGPADSLAQSHRVIVPDLRGFGRTPLSDPTPADVRAMAGDLRRLCEWLTTEPVHVVGYSMGGTLAAQLALEEPGRFAGVTFVAGAFWEDSAAAARELVPHAAAVRGEAGVAPFFAYILPSWNDSARGELVAQVMADNDRRVLSTVLEGLPGLMPDWTRVRLARTPAVAIVGTADPLWSHSRRLVSRWPGATFVAVPGGDHADIPYAAAVVDAVVQAVRRRARSATPVE